MEWGGFCGGGARVVCGDFVVILWGKEVVGAEGKGSGGLVCGDFVGNWWGIGGELVGNWWGIGGELVFSITLSVK